MRDRSAEKLREMVDAIVNEIDPDQVVLFGSLARGDEGPDSDVDLIVVENKPFGPGRSRRREISRVRRALSRFRGPKDILVYSSDEVAKWRDSANHILGRGLREGRILYERS